MTEQDADEVSIPLKNKDDIKFVLEALMAKYKITGLRRYREIAQRLEKYGNGTKSKYPLLLPSTSTFWGWKGIYEALAIISFIAAVGYLSDARTLNDYVRIITTTASVIGIILGVRMTWPRRG